MKTFESAPETGVKIIDTHHKKFYELLLVLNEIIENKTCSPDLPTFMHKLSFFAEDYFLDEESALSKNQFTNLKKHKDEHKIFVDGVKNFQQKFFEGDKNICRPLFDFLATWYHNHVQNYDIEAAKFLIEKGF
jgi:hemerythrin